MFKVFVVEDIVTLAVSEYVRDRDEILFRKLSNKYANKVIGGVGLGISVDSAFLSRECKILPNDGSANYKLRFRLLVFCPETNDVFKAQVTNMNQNFIKLSIGFFSDIHVIAKSLPDTYKFDEENGCWNTEDGQVKVDDTVTFKVSDVIYNPDQPKSEGFEPLPILMVIGTIL